MSKCGALSAIVSLSPFQSHSVFSSCDSEDLSVCFFLLSPRSLRLFLYICFWLSRVNFVAVPAFTELILCHVHLVRAVRFFFSLVSVVFQFSDFHLVLCFVSNYYYYFNKNLLYFSFFFKRIYSCSLKHVYDNWFVVCVSMCVKARGQGWVSTSIIFHLVFWLGAHQVGWPGWTVSSMSCFSCGGWGSDSGPHRVQQALIFLLSDCF